MVQFKMAWTVRAGCVSRGREFGASVRFLNVFGDCTYDSKVIILFIYLYVGSIQQFHSLNET
jgi:hypothetical protein